MVKWATGRLPTLRLGGRLESGVGEAEVVKNIGGDPSFLGWRGVYENGKVCAALKKEVFCLNRRTFLVCSNAIMC
jgi:hypothetical protein